MAKKIVFRKTLALVIMFVATSSVFAQKDPPEYTEWYAGGTVGISLSGLDFGLYGAYFFNEKYGGGLVARKIIDESFVIAATFFAHWEIGSTKLFIPTRIGFGFDKQRIPDKRQETTALYYAGYASAGIAYRPSKLMSFGINAEYASALENMSGDFLGFNIGISFHF